MSVYKRGDVYWSQFFVNGQRIRLSTGKANERAAKEWEREKIQTLKGDQVVAILAKKVNEVCFGESITIAAAFDEFLKVPRRTVSSEARTMINRSKFEDFVLYMAAEFPDVVKMAAVTAIHAENYVKYLREYGRYSKDVLYKRGDKVISHEAKLATLAAATINDNIAVCKMVFATLAERASIHTNPFAKIFSQKKDTVTREAFSPEELKLIGEQSKGTYLYPLFLTGISTGLREGDICTLRWSEINLATGWIDRVLNKTGKKVSIPILPGLARYLAELPRDGEYCYPELAAMYEHNRGKIGKDVTKFLEGIGIQSTMVAPGRSRASSIKDVHSLRHTFAYLAAVNNIPLPVVQSILGHFSPEMTKAYSNHATAQAKADFMRMVPDYIGGTIERTERTKRTENIADKLRSMTAANWESVRDELLKLV